MPCYRAALTTVALAFGLSPAIIASRGGPLEVEARTVGEALPVDQLPAIGHPPEER